MENNKCKINGDGNGPKQDPKTGQFIPGNGGGPGRPKGGKKKPKRGPLDEVAEMAREIMNEAQDASIRLKAGALLTKLPRPDEEPGATLSPVMAQALGVLAGASPSPGNTCPHCGQVVQGGSEGEDFCINFDEG